MMRTQECRGKIDWIIEHCEGLNAETIRELKNAQEFCDIHPEISGLSTHAVQPLIRAKDPEVRDMAIEFVGKSLESGKNPVTGRFSSKPPSEMLRR